MSCLVASLNLARSWSIKSVGFSQVNFLFGIGALKGKTLSKSKAGPGFHSVGDEFYAFKLFMSKLLTIFSGVKNFGSSMVRILILVKYILFLLIYNENLAFKPK